MLQRGSDGSTGCAARDGRLARLGARRQGSVAVLCGLVASAVKSKWWQVTGAAVPAARHQPRGLATALNLKRA